MRSPLREAERCFLQAESDLQFARLAVREGFFAQACFICQQCGEKVLKSLAYSRGERLVLGHSLYSLVGRLSGAFPELETFKQDAGLLDQYYVATRYPNGLPDGAPFQVFREDQAVQAIELATSLMQTARHILIRAGVDLSPDTETPNGE